MTGIDDIRAEWILDGPVAPRLKELAATWLRNHGRMITPRPLATIELWLGSLGIQCAGSSTPNDEAQMRAKAYATTLEDRPAYWFTRGTLKAAAIHFKWFPAAAELVEFLTKMTNERSSQVNTARMIERGPLGPQPRRAFVMEPIGVRLRAIADSYARHYGADDPRTIRAREAFDRSGAA